MTTPVLNRCAHVLALCILAASEAAQSQGGRPWSVADSVAVRYFVASPDAHGEIGIPSPGDKPVVFSPDGEHFFFTSLSGDAAKDEVTYKLWIFSTSDVRSALLSADNRKPPAPVRTVIMKSRFAEQTLAPAIALPIWESDDVISFVGTEGRTIRRPYSFSLRSGQLRPLTPPTVLNGTGRMYSMSGDTLVYWTMEKEDERQKPDAPFALIDSLALDLERDVHFANEKVAFYQVRAGQARSLIKLESASGSAPWISPDGKHALISGALPGVAAPLSWKNYRFAPIAFGSLQITFQDTRARWILLNLDQNTSRPLFDAPQAPGKYPFNRSNATGWGNFHEAYWSFDSGTVLLINTALPLNENEARATQSWIASYDLRSGQIAELDEFPVTFERRVDRVQWLDEGRALLVMFVGPDKREISSRIYRYDGKFWRGENADAENAPKSDSPEDFQVALRESANDPPRIVATNGNRSLDLTGEDPALQGVKRAQVETLRWKDSDGRDVESLLMLPSRGKDSRRPRLVIQISDPWNPPDAFRPDGEVGTGFAAQPLVAQGFAVLQMEPACCNRKTRGSDPALYETPGEGMAQVRRVDAAVEMLRSQGLIVDAPIGLIGFSRSGYYVHYIATHPGKTTIGAGVVFDSVTYGFASYIQVSALSGAAQAEQYGAQYGAPKPSFWEAKQAWLDAPVFNLEKLRTPILFSVTKTKSSALEVVGSYQLAKRPFEYHFFPKAGHLMQSAAQRGAAMQATVDWMGFWLLSKPPQASDDPGRLFRWEKIRSEWIRTQASESAKVAEP